MLILEWLRCIIVPLFEIIWCTCVDMRLSISWARGDRPCWGWWDVKIVIWTRGERPCGNCWFYDCALRSLHRDVEIVRVGIWTSRVPHGSWSLDVFLRSIMYIRLSEYWVFWNDSLHGTILHCISSHHLFLMIMCFVWCLESTWCLITFIDELK